VCVVLALAWSGGIGAGCPCIVILAVREPLFGRVSVAPVRGACSVKAGLAAAVQGQSGSATTSSGVLTYPTPFAAAIGGCRLSRCASATTGGDELGGLTRVKPFKYSYEKVGGRCREPA